MGKKQNTKPARAAPKKPARRSDSQRAEAFADAFRNECAKSGVHCLGDTKAALKPVQANKAAKLLAAKWVEEVFKRMSNRLDEIAGTNEPTQEDVAAMLHQLHAEGVIAHMTLATGTVGDAAIPSNIQKGIDQRRARRAESRAERDRREQTAGTLGLEPEDIVAARKHAAALRALDRAKQRADASSAAHAKVMAAASRARMDIDDVLEVN